MEVSPRQSSDVPTTFPQSQTQESINPPSVNYHTKPSISTVDNNYHELESGCNHPNRDLTPPELGSRATQSNSVELDSRVIQPSSVELDSRTIQPSPSELDGRIIQQTSTSPSYSSLVVENNSIPSHINEIGFNVSTVSPQTSSIVESDNHLNSNDSLSKISNYTGSDSANTSLVNERGSASVHRYNADDYSNPDLNQDLDVSPGVNIDGAVNITEVGYLAPTPEPSGRYDYTERIYPKTSLGDVFTLKFKSINSRIEGVYLKYENIAKRKSFWKVWEKHKGRYESYEDFKSCWNPKTPIFKTIAKEFKADIKQEFKDGFGINRGSRGGNITSEVNRFINNNRPFNR